jgi:hypothetical protein
MMEFKVVTVQNIVLLKILTTFKLLFLWGSKYNVKKRIIIRTRPFLSYVVHLKRFSLYIYWPIECIPKPSFVEFKVARITYIYWPIDCTKKLSCMGVFKVPRITYIYWPIECTSKL